LFEILFKYPRSDYARSELVYTGDWPGWLLVTLIVIAIAGITWMMYRRRRFVGAASVGAASAAIHYTKLAIVGLLQVAMLAVVIWALRQPTLSTEQLRAGENAVAFVVDNSESMAYGESESRLMEAVRSLGTSLSQDTLLNLKVQHYELSDRARPVDSFLATEPSGAETSLAASLTDVLREARFSPLAAIVLGSDGADTSGGLSPAALAEVAGFGVPVHTLGVGREAIAEDIELVDVVLPESARIAAGRIATGRECDYGLGQYRTCRSGTPPYSFQC
jgi:hypothetical protein